MCTLSYKRANDRGEDILHIECKNLINPQYNRVTCVVYIKMRLFKNKPQRLFIVSTEYLQYSTVRFNGKSDIECGDVAKNIRKREPFLYLIACVHKSSHNWAITIGYRITLKWSTFSLTREHAYTSFLALVNEFLKISGCWWEENF